MHHILFLNLFNNYFGENHIFVVVFLSSGSRQEVSVEVFGVFQVLSSLSFPKVHKYQRAVIELERVVMGRTTYVQSSIVQSQK